MPIYEYECQACGHLHEALQKMSDEPLTDCPACGQAQLKKLISKVAFRLKGQGWYETDFKKDKQRNLVSSDSEEKSSSKSTDKQANKTEGNSKSSNKQSSDSSSSSTSASSKTSEA